MHFSAQVLSIVLYFIKKLKYTITTYMKMLTPDITRKIEDFVYSKPRSIQEIAHLIGKNWRTADRYVDEIEKDFGTVSTRVFREKTRGALKVVFWSSVENVSHSVFQKQIEEQIISGKGKYDFQAFDIFQYIEDKDKKASIEKEKSEEATNLKEYCDLLKSAKKQLIFFSGNLSFINLKAKDADIFKTLEDLAKKGVTIKIICRVDFAGKDNVEKILSLNFKQGKDIIEVRHREQPLRAVIIDNQIIRIKEIKEPTGKSFELSKKMFIFYTIRNKEWAEWLSRLFWKMFSSSISAEKRLQEINKLGL